MVLYRHCGGIVYILTSISQHFYFNTVMYGLFHDYQNHSRLR